MHVNWKFEHPVPHWVQSKLSVLAIYRCHGLLVWLYSGWMTCNRLPPQSPYSSDLDPRDYQSITHSTKEIQTSVPFLIQKEITPYPLLQLLPFQKACILPSAYETLYSVCFLGCWHCVQAFCFRLYDHIHVLRVLLPSRCPKDLPPVSWLICKLLSPSPDIPSLKLSSQGKKFFLRKVVLPFFVKRALYIVSSSFSSKMRAW